MYIVHGLSCHLSVTSWFKILHKKSLPLDRVEYPIEDKNYTALQLFT